MEQTFSETVNNLKKQVDFLGGAEAHFAANDIQNEKGTTAVLSVYKGVKPSHMILDELYVWAEKSAPEVAKKIEELSNDMSWNK